MEEWASYTARECDICHSKYRPEGHHIIEQQHVEDAARELGLDWEAYLWDPRNHMTACDGCHDPHHLGGPKIKLALVARVSPGVFDFADELGLRQRLRQSYA